MNIFKDIEFLKYPTKLLLRKYDYMSIILLCMESGDPAQDPALCSLQYLCVVRTVIEHNYVCCSYL